MQTDNYGRCMASIFLASNGSKKLVPLAKNPGFRVSEGDSLREAQDVDISMAHFLINSQDVSLPIPFGGPERLKTSTGSFRTLG